MSGTKRLARATVRITVTVDTGEVWNDAATIGEVERVAQNVATQRVSEALRGATGCRIAKVERVEVLVSTEEGP